jgi:hypothetical protein
MGLRKLPAPTATFCFRKLITQRLFRGFINSQFEGR